MPKKNTGNPRSLLPKLGPLHQYLIYELVGLNTTVQARKPIKDWNAITILFRLLTTNEEAFRIFLYLFLAAKPNEINNVEDLWQTIKLKDINKIGIKNLQLFFYRHIESLSTSYSNVQLDFSILPLTTKEDQISQVRLVLEIINRLMTKNTILLRSIDLEKEKKIKNDIIQEAYSFLENNQMLDQSCYKNQDTLPLTNIQKTLLFYLAEMNQLRGEIQDWNSISELLNLLLTDETAFLIFNSIYNKKKIKTDFEQLFLQMQRAPSQPAFSRKKLAACYSHMKKISSGFNRSDDYKFSLNTSRFSETNATFINRAESILKTIKEIIKNESLEEEKITQEEDGCPQKEIALAKEKTSPRENMGICPKETHSSDTSFISDMPEELGMVEEREEKSSILKEPQTIGKCLQSQVRESYLQYADSTSGLGVQNSSVHAPEYSKNNQFTFFNNSPNFSNNPASSANSMELAPDQTK